MNKFKHNNLFLAFLAVFLLAMLFPVVILAHPGGTDENGGHYDTSTGEYHYHHGYPAHQHTNGTCPYDFDDRTGWNSGSSGSSSNEEGDHFLIFILFLALIGISSFFFLKKKHDDMEYEQFLRRVTRETRRTPTHTRKNNVIDINDDLPEEDFFTRYILTNNIYYPKYDNTTYTPEEQKKVLQRIAEYRKNSTGQKCDQQRENNQKQLE